MAMSKGEEETIRNVLARLKCEARPDGSQREADEVRAALTGPARLYLQTWVIGSLEHLLPEKRNVDLARKLSR